MEDPGVVYRPGADGLSLRGGIVVSTHFKATASMATLLLSLSLAVPAAAQTTIFNTKDFHQDRAL